MSLFIKDFDLPGEDVEPLTVEIYADGSVIIRKAADDFYEFHAKQIPEGLRLLIDKDVLYAFVTSITEETKETGNVRATFNEVYHVVKDVPTYIET